MYYHTHLLVATYAVNLSKLYFAFPTKTKPIVAVTRKRMPNFVKRLTNNSRSKIAPISMIDVPLIKLSSSNSSVSLLAVVVFTMHIEL